MAESTLSVDINDLRLEVALLVGWPRTISNWGATRLADFDVVSARALREFYFPAISPDTPRYEWGFLRKEGTVTLASTDFDYDLPDDFGGTILDSSVTAAAGKNQQPLSKVSEGELRAMRSGDSQDNGYPKYYAVRNKAHSAVNGQRWEMLVFPTPGASEATEVITFRYAYIPEVLSNTNIYPAGGAQYSEVIVAAHRAAAEAVLDTDTQGQEAARFQTMLATAVRNDQQQKELADQGKA